MRLEDFHYLLEINECKSINKAAQKLFISHSTLSYVLQNIEKDLGYKLFIRNNQGVTPTPRGEEVLNECRVILDMIEHWHKNPEQNQQIKGHVRVASIPIISRILGTDLIIRLKKDYPNLNLHFEENQLFNINALLRYLSKSSARIIIGALEDPEISVLKYQFSSDPQWRYSCYRGDELCLHINKSHPLANRTILYPEELSELPLLFYPGADGRFGHSQVLRHFSAVQAYSISTADSVLEMVAQNYSVSLSSKLATSNADSVQNGSVKRLRIDGYPMSMNYFILYPNTTDISPAEQIIVRMFQECFKSLEPFGIFEY